MQKDQDRPERPFDLYENSAVRDFLHHAEKVAGFSLPPSFKALFDSHWHHCFDDPIPEFTKNYGPESLNWKWQKLHHEAIMGSTLSAATAVIYHSDNLLRIEREVLAFREIGSIPRHGESALGGGNTLKLDFEYHAFIFAFRRVLDYLAKGIAALVKEECKSFNKLPGSLRNHANKPWICLITNMHSKFMPQLEAFVHLDRGYSTRDKIAHHFPVTAGCLCINVKGVYFSGGGEELDPTMTLGAVINGYIDTLQEILSESFSAMALGMPKIAEQHINATVSCSGVSRYRLY